LDRGGAEPEPRADEQDARERLEADEHLTRPPRRRAGAALEDQDVADQADREQAGAAVSHELPELNLDVAVMPREPRGERPEGDGEGEDDLDHALLYVRRRGADLSAPGGGGPEPKAT